jgi:hypothetical protein
VSRRIVFVVPIGYVLLWLAARLLGGQITAWALLLAAAGLAVITGVIVGLAWPLLRPPPPRPPRAEREQQLALPPAPPRRALPAPVRKELTQ